MLRQRVITAVILFIIILAALYIGPWAFTAVAAFAIGATLWEWLRIARWPGSVSMACGVLAGIGLYCLEMFAPAEVNFFQQGQGLLILSSIGTVIWLVLTALVFLKRHIGWSVPSAWSWLSAWILVPCAWFCMMYLYRTYGAVYLISVLAIAWIADIMAYFGGGRFKGPKMCTGISPKKTWSGAMTAFVCTIGVALIAYLSVPEAPLWSNTVFSSSNIPMAMLIIFVAVLFSIAGDLFESALKRTAGIKDSSNLLPGHGGMYDRLDAQFATLPLAVFTLLMLQGI